MSRRFAAADSLTCAPGGANLTRAGTVIVLVRAFDAVFDALTTNTDFVFGRAGTAAVWGMFLDSSKIFAPNDFGAGLAGPSNKATFYAIGVTKPSGTAAYRYHIAPVGGAWTHAASGNSADGSGVTNVLFGAGPVKGTAKWDIAAAATYAAAFSDAGVEALGIADMADWMGAGPSAAWQFNQASTAEPVVDLTGGGADQTGIVGTAIAPDPPGWSYFVPGGEPVIDRPGRLAALAATSGLASSASTSHLVAAAATSGLRVEVGP